VAYIGVQPKAGQYRKLDDISSGFNGATTTFTTSVDGDNVTAPAPQQLLVSIGGVIQQPNVDYITNTNSITFTTAPTAGLSFFAILMGDAVNIGTPSDGSVTTAKLVNDSVTTAKLDSAGIAPIVTSLNGGPLSGARNRIINGDMRIDQRNSSQTVNSNGNVYSVDRWFGSGVATAGVFTVASSTTAPANFTNSLLATVTTADASIGASNRYILVQRIEGNNVADLGWGTANAKAVVLSFWVRSSLTGTFGGSVRNSATDRSYPFSYSISAANTWEQKTVSIAGDTSGTWLTDTGIGITLSFALGAGSSAKGTAGAWSASNLSSATGAVDLIGTNGATFYITGVQLEAGTVATPFERRSYGQELALCQRYYYRLTLDIAGRFGVGQCTSTTTALIYTPFFVSMRAAPSSVEQNGTAADYRLLNSAGSGIAGSSVPTFNISSTSGASSLFTVASGIVAGNATFGFAGTSGAYLAWSAEL